MCTYTVCMKYTVEKVLDGVNVVQWLRRGGRRVRGQQRGAPRGARQRQESRWKTVSYSRCCLDKPLNKGFLMKFCQDLFDK